jgi:paraquat-inducible protein B
MNPALVGVFVLGAVALVVAAVVVFGSGRLFRETEEFVLFFDGSVNGLEVGAPVKFRGVPIGSVTKILLRIKEEGPEPEPAIPVFVEIDTSRTTTQLGVQADLGDPRVMRQLVYEQGLRAQLQTQSIITGVLYVGLDVHPGTPIVLRLPEGAPYREIPTLPTTFETLFKEVRDIFAELRGTDLAGLVASAREAIRDLGALAGSPELKSAVTAANEALRSIDRLARNLDGEIEPLSESVKATLVSAETGLTQGKSALAGAADLLAPGSPFMHKLERALDEMAAAGRAVAALADYLERNPNALLVGRPAPEGSP